MRNNYFSSEINVGHSTNTFFNSNKDNPDGLPSSKNDPDRDRSGKSVLGNRILVVEDDDKVRAISVSILQHYGYDVTEARDGNEAIQLVNREETFDLLFTDIILPGGMNGAEVAGKIFQIQPTIKILYTSGYLNGSSLQGNSPGKQDVLLSKPFRHHELIEQVEKLIGKSEAE